MIPFYKFHFEMTKFYRNGEQINKHQVPDDKDNRKLGG